jgi:ABC-type uncharacterized transport system substrate-binding protein
MAAGRARLTRRIRRAATGALLAAAAGGPVAEPPPATPERILVLARRPGVPSIALLLETLRRREGDRGQARPRIDTDVRIIDPALTEQALDELAPSLPRYKAVFATTMALARATQARDPRIPIVFDGAANPVDMCLVDTLQKPGRNATGYTNHLPTDEGKMVEALIDGFPALRTVYFLVADDVFPQDCAGSVQDAPPPCIAGIREPDPMLRRMASVDEIVGQAARRGVRARFVVLCGPQDFKLLAALDPGRRDVGYAVPWQNLFFSQTAALVSVIGTTRRPAIYGGHLFTDAGGVLSLEPIRDAADREAPVHALLQVLDGRAPASIPVQVPRGFKLRLNASAAARQGLQPSLLLMRRADEIMSAP